MGQAAIKAISLFFPEKIEANDPEKRLTKKTGIFYRHIAAKHECASDLALKAAERMFQEYSIERSSIDYLLFCTQSPDYFLPTTACLLQTRLKLVRQCGAIDFNMGCSGYIYGLSLAKGLIESGQANNVLLLTGETYSKYIHPEDMTVRPLFGDAGTATLISNSEYREVVSPLLHSFVFGTDGTGADALIVSAGGARNAVSDSAFEDNVAEEGVLQSKRYLYMNGSLISNFALDVVPTTVENILTMANLTKNEIDYYVFHQANRFMLEFLQAKCELQGLPFWNNVEHCGNTVSSSIPVALRQMLDEKQQGTLERVMLVGFGVGLSWAGCIVDLSQMLSKRDG